METEKVFTEKLFRTGDGRTVTYSEMIKEIEDFESAHGIVKKKKK